MTAEGEAAYIGLGSNQGDSLEILRSAVREMALLGEVQCSSVWRTAPWGPVPQAHFLNAVARLQTCYTPDELLTELYAIEQRKGRRRAERWGPRKLDLDILLYGNLQLATERLQIPHPHLHERAFVLVPLTELVTDIQVPGLGWLSELLDGRSQQGMQQLHEQL